MYGRRFINAFTYINLWNEKKVDEAADFLKSWEKKSKKDPELYVCYFNMYIMQASKEQMHVESFLPPNFNGQYMEGQNENGDKLYIYSIIEYDDDITLYPGHDEITSLGYEKKNNPYLNK